MPRLTLTALPVIALLMLPVAAQAAGATAATDKTAVKAAEPTVPEVTPEKIKEEAFQRGKRAYDRGDWLKAITDLRPLAEMNDVRAMVLLGNMYAEGNGVIQSNEEAFALYHKAALLENTDGMVAIAALYRQGMGVGINTRLAIGWFNRAARLGDQQGAFFYGISIFEGSKGTTYDLKPDRKLAYKWFRIAATHGDNKKMRFQAYKVAEIIAKDLPPDQVIDLEKEVKDWAPDTLDVIGDNPEKILADEMAKKAADTPDKKTP
ncbi:MAG: tetratricopeptide repeat protein [Micavibrio sp.]|nr:tetratricopeptide repeat protein [Micavibrio sp.]